MPDKPPKKSNVNSAKSKPISHDNELLNYLKSRFEVDVDKTKRSWLYMKSSNTTIYVNDSKERGVENVGWYDLEKTIFDELIRTSSYYAIVLNDPSKTFIIPSKKLENIFGAQDLKTELDDKRKPEWMFTIQESSSKFTLRINNDKKSDSVIDNYLNNWKQIPDFENKKPLQFVFLTAYDDKNVKISKSNKILGWKKRSQTYMGDLVFVYNKTSKTIECAFKIKSKSNRKEPLWNDEINSNPQKLLYKNRWDAELVSDNLNISLDDINQIPPFKADAGGKKAQLGLLILGDSPNSLTKPIYKPFKDFLLAKSNQVGLDHPDTATPWSFDWSFDVDDALKEILSPETDDELAIDAELVKRILNHLKSGKNVILVGPPGVGKTDLARRVLKIIGKKVLGCEDFIQSVASDEWSRFDVIGGLDIDNKFQEGWIIKAIKDKKWLLIDEFNRANMNKAFGEMFLGLEYNQIDLKPSETKVYGNRLIEIDKAFRMICTMNDFDKNLLLSELSYGLISRFAFVSITPYTDKEFEVVKKRVKKILNDNVKYDEYTNQIEKYFSFINDVRQERNIGVRTSIDVIKYLIISTKDYQEKNTNENYKWVALNDALCDYVLPQFDRLDGKTIKHVLTNAKKYFKDIKDENQKSIFANFISELEKTLDNLQKASDWLSDKNDF